MPTFRNDSYEKGYFTRERAVTRERDRGFVEKKHTQLKPGKESNTASETGVPPEGR